MLLEKETKEREKKAMKETDQFLETQSDLDNESELEEMTDSDTGDYEVRAEDLMFPETEVVERKAESSKFYLVAIG